MYRASSPIFDMPEFPTLRRVKPLPKRRRTSGSATMAMAGAATTTATTATTTVAPTARSGSGVMSPSDHLAVLAGNPILLASSLEDLRLPGPDATPEELLAHAETLSARMALQSYYMPMLAGATGLGVAANSNVGTGAAPGAEFLDSGGGDGAEGGTGNANASGNAVGKFGADAFGSGLLADLAASGMGATIGFGSAYGAGRGGGDEDDDDEQGDGDYIDHLQQPGNTKKRKVPAHPSGLTGRGHEFDSPTRIGGSDFILGQDELGGDRAIASAEREHDIAEIYQPFSSLPSAPSLGLSPAGLGSGLGPGIFSTVTSVAQLAQRKSKLTAATLAGLQHKEMLKSRKRQLAAVLGALSHGDTLALDQALSANYPFATPGFDDAKSGASGGAGSDPPKVRLSRRIVVRMSRGARRHPRHPDQAPFPMCDFTFVCPSATADRLIATKEEVAMLRNRFEAELARQAAKAAKMAAANKMIASAPAKSGKSKRTDRAQQRARTITEGKSTAGGNNDQADTASQPSPTGGASTTGVKPKAGGKKKKRSALANASNPHHLRNYVPSRLPHAGGQNAAGNTAGANGRDTLWPLPLRFLSAEIPPRRRKKPMDAPQPIVSSQLTNPAEEWICAFCEYGLFYGDEADYRRAVRNRKKILRRRRRARERAAAAASGNGTAVKPHEKNAPVNEEYDGVPAFETSTDDVAGHQQHGRQGKWKGGPDKERGESYG